MTLEQGLVCFFSKGTDSHYLGFLGHTVEQPLNFATTQGKLPRTTCKQLNTPIKLYLFKQAPGHHWPLVYTVCQLLS